MESYRVTQTWLYPKFMNKIGMCVMCRRRVLRTIMLHDTIDLKYASSISKWMIYTYSDLLPNSRCFCFYFNYKFGSYTISIPNAYYLEAKYILIRLFLEVYSIYQLIHFDNWASLSHENWKLVVQQQSLKWFAVECNKSILFSNT
jgi:hypothetical protein